MEAWCRAGASLKCGARFFADISMSQITVTITVWELNQWLKQGDQLFLVLFVYVKHHCLAKENLNRQKCMS